MNNRGEDTSGHQEATAESFKLERLKFVLQQIDRLNERFHRYVAQFQTLATLIVGAAAAVVVGRTDAQLSVQVTTQLITGLFGLLTLVAVFVIVLIATGMAAWFDYRMEEKRILDEALGAGYRHAPSVRQLLRWHETYVILMIVAATATIDWFVFTSVLPTIE